MTKRKRRRRSTNNQSPIGDVLRMIFAIALIAIAVVLVVFVFGKVKDTALLPGFGGKNEEMSAESQSGNALNENSEDDTLDGESKTLEEAGHPGFHVNEDGKTYYLAKQDGEPVKSTWIEEGNRLYYFGQDGFMKTGSYSENGMIYTFSDDGVVKQIRYNSAYKPDAASVNPDYQSLVTSKKVWAYLLPDKKDGNYFALMYKKTTDPMPHQLGGDENPQYTGPYSIQIDGDYIYFMTRTEKPSDSEQAQNGNIYRMKPGSTERELAAEKANGYKAINGAVYYDANGKINRTTTFTKDEQKQKNTADSGDYQIDISKSTKAYLTDNAGNVIEPQEDGSRMKVGNFTYKLGKDGEIQDVQVKTSVNKSGYTYSIESSQLFGKTVSHVVRKGKDGVIEAISSEFEGTTGNLHYDADSGAMFAEYEDSAGDSHILRISLDGDVDCLKEEGSGLGRLLLYGFEKGKLICKEITGNTSKFITLDKNAVLPLAVGVDPVKLIDSGEAEETETTEKAAAGSHTENKKETETTAAIAAPPKAEEKQHQPEGPKVTSDNGADAGDEKQKETKTELIGPGNSALIGGAPS